MSEHNFSEQQQREIQEILKEASFSKQTNSIDEMYIKLGRIPLICQAIITTNEKMDDMKSSIKAIEDNINWGVKVVIGAVILALLGLITITKL